MSYLSFTRVGIFVWFVYCFVFRVWDGFWYLVYVELGENGEWWRRGRFLFSCFESEGFVFAGLLG